MKLKEATNIVEVTIQTLAAVVKGIGVGTNLGLVRLMWAMMNGSFLSSRGSIHEALAQSSFAKEEISRTWAGFAYGQWSITRLVRAWRAHVKDKGEWQGHVREGYQGVAADMSSFRRPQ